MCSIVIQHYRPTSRALDAAAISVEVASTDFDAAAGKVVEYISVNGHTLASNYTTPSSKICDGFSPAITQVNVLPYITDTVDRLEVRACLCFDSSRPIVTLWCQGSREDLCGCAQPQRRRRSVPGLQASFCALQRLQSVTFDVTDRA